MLALSTCAMQSLCAYMYNTECRQSYSLVRIELRGQRMVISIVFQYYFVDPKDTEAKVAPVF